MGETIDEAKVVLVWTVGKVVGNTSERVIGAGGSVAPLTTGVGGSVARIIAGAERTNGRAIGDRAKLMLLSTSSVVGVVAIVEEVEAEFNIEVAPRDRSIAAAGAVEGPVAIGIVLYHSGAIISGPGRIGWSGKSDECR